ncbi:hypothetical protein ACIQ34_13475 [Ureibacillus sp. NPDC094379]
MDFFMYNTLTLCNFMSYLNEVHTMKFISDTSLSIFELHNPDEVHFQCYAF